MMELLNKQDKIYSAFESVADMPRTELLIVLNSVKGVSLPEPAKTKEYKEFVDSHGLDLDFFFRNTILDHEIWDKETERTAFELYQNELSLLRNAVYERDKDENIKTSGLCGLIEHMQNKTYAPHINLQKKRCIKTRNIISGYYFKSVFDLTKKHFFDSQYQLFDHFENGIMGLLRAIDSFDCKRGFKFLTYATKIIQSTMYEKEEQTRTAISLPEYINLFLRMLNTAEELFFQENNRKPTREELCVNPVLIKYFSKRLKTKDEEEISEYVAAAIKYVRQSTSIESLDKKLNDDGDATLADMLASDGDVTDDFKYLDNAIETVLNPAEQELIIELFYQGKSDADLAREKNVSRMTIGNRKFKALKKLKKFLQEEK